VVSNATEPGRQKNRRVDIVLYQPGSAADPAGKTVEMSDSGYNVSRLGPKSSDAPSPSAAAVGDLAPSASTTPTLLEPPSVNEPANPETVIQDAVDGKSVIPAPSQ
jgi:hypothetical protein